MNRGYSWSTNYEVAGQYAESQLANGKYWLIVVMMINMMMDNYDD